MGILRLNWGDLGTERILEWRGGMDWEVNFKIEWNDGYWDWLGE